MVATTGGVPTAGVRPPEAPGTSADCGHDTFVGVAAGSTARWLNFPSSQPDAGLEALPPSAAIQPVWTAGADRVHRVTKLDQFTILRTLPKSMTAGEVIEIEAAFKRKLGSRAFGLNAN